jgi:hypothetical protein
VKTQLANIARIIVDHDRAAALYDGAQFCTNAVDSAKVPYGVPYAPAAAVERLKSAVAAVERAEAELAAEQAAAAVKARFDYDEDLATATLVLINGARALRSGGVSPTGSSSNRLLAKYRKELAPLAASYSVKIVLVGDKTTARLVLA